ncbi:hypothetical protein [Roseateles oligotrophus]|nr:hypothetical protein [Roseateles oligotrophus]
MAQIFPKKNDYGTASFDELVPELLRFGIRTRKDFKQLMVSNKRQLLEIDRSPLSAWEILHAKQTLGEEFVKDSIRRQYWFAFPALVRTAMELEFGEEACVYEEEA